MYEDLGSSFQGKYPEGVHVDQFNKNHAWDLKSEIERPSQMHLDTYFDNSLYETAWILTLEYHETYLNELCTKVPPVIFKHIQQTE